MNHYTSRVVYPTPPENIDPSSVSIFTDSDVTEYVDPKWYAGASSWLKVVPYGLRRLTSYLHQIYKKPIYITENGFSDFLGNVDDLQRVYYYKHYINQLLKSVNEDGSDIRGYFAWSLMDNFEWAMGYS